MPRGIRTPSPGSSTLVRDNETARAVPEGPCIDAEDRLDSKTEGEVLADATIQRRSAMMCPHCYATNEDDAVFCVNCRKRMKKLKNGEKSYHTKTAQQ